MERSGSARLLFTSFPTRFICARVCFITLLHKIFATPEKIAKLKRRKNLLTRKLKDIILKIKSSCIKRDFVNLYLVSFIC